MYLCFCWCFVPLWAHSIPTSTVACSRRLGCYPGVLPRPCVRAAAAFASRSGLAGGRVLGVTSLGADVAEAQKKVYQAVKSIDWDDGFYRNDIAYRAIGRKG